MKNSLKRLVVLIMAIFISVTTYASSTYITRNGEIIPAESQATAVSMLNEDANTITFVIKQEKDSNWPRVSHIWDNDGNIRYEIFSMVDKKGDNWEITLSGIDSNVSEELHMGINIDGYLNFVSFNTSEVGMVKEITFNYSGTKVDFNLDYQEPGGKIDSVEVYKKANNGEYIEVGVYWSDQVQNMHLPEGEEYICGVIAYDQSNQYYICEPIVNNQFTMSGDRIEKIHIKHSDAQYGTVIDGIFVHANDKINSFMAIGNKLLQGPNEVNLYVDKEVTRPISVLLQTTDEKTTYSLDGRDNIDLTKGPQSIATDANFTTNINIRNISFAPNKKVSLRLGEDINIQDSYGNYIDWIYDRQSDKEDNVAHVTYKKGNETFEAIGEVNGSLRVKTPAEPGEYDFLLSIDEALPVYIPSAQGKIMIGETTTQSSNANLSSLTVNKGTLTPGFSPSTTDYKVTVDNSVSSIVIGATAADAKASVTGAGEKALVVGENTIKINVKAENGNSKTYTIVVTRQGNMEGWVQDHGNWYYYVGGKPVTGWANIAGQIRYFNEAGILTTGWANIGGYWRYFNEEGVLANGWTTINGYLRYFNEDGMLTTGWANISGYWRYFDENGVLANGWTYIDGYLRYFNEDGILTTGWANISGYWRYFDENGVLANGWMTINGYLRYFDENGILTIGWANIGGYWRYFNEDGVIYLNGWYEVNGYERYFDENGIMATHTIVDGWVVNEDGVKVGRA